MSEAVSPAVSDAVRTYECSICRWKKNISFSRQCLGKGRGVFSTCPQCGNKKINSYERKTRLERWLDGV